MSKNYNLIDLNSTVDTSKLISSILLQLTKILSEEVEELNVSSYLFRDGLCSSLGFIFESIITKKESVLVFTDTVPGFTVTVFKKKNFTYNYEDFEVNNNKPLVVQNSENSAMQSVFESFTKKNEPNIIVIETNDLLIALFPLSETKKNLKELGLYITY